MKRGIHQKISTGALLLTAASMPFSVVVCHWSFVAFVVCWLFEGQWRQKLSILTANKFALLLPLFFLVHVAGMLYTDNISSGWSQLEKKAAVFLVPLTLATTRRVTESTAHLLLKAFVMSCLAATLICLGNATWLMISGSPQQNFSDFTMNEFLRLNPDVSLAWMNFSYATLSSGIGMHPTYLGLYLSGCLMMLLYLHKQDRLSGLARWIAPFLFVYFTVFIFFLSSRIAIIAAVAISLSALVCVSPRRNLSLVLARLGAAVALFALIVYANPVSRFRGLQEPATASLGDVAYATTSIDIRISLLRLSTLATSNVNPWAGTGTGAGVDLLRAAGAEHNISNVLDTYDPHNQFLYTFFELGFLGLAVLMAVLFVPLYDAWKKRSYLYAGFALVFVAVCLTESVFELQKGIIMFSFFGSLLTFQLTRREAPPDNRV